MMTFSNAELVQAITRKTFSIQRTISFIEVWRGVSSQTELSFLKASCICHSRSTLLQGQQVHVFHAMADAH